MFQERVWPCPGETRAAPVRGPQAATTEQGQLLRSLEARIEVVEGGAGGLAALAALDGKKPGRVWPRWMRQLRRATLLAMGVVVIVLLSVVVDGWRRHDSRHKARTERFQRWSEFHGRHNGTAAAAAHAGRNGTAAAGGRFHDIGRFERGPAAAETAASSTALSLATAPP